MELSKTKTAPGIILTATENREKTAGIKVLSDMVTPAGTITEQTEKLIPAGKT